MLHVVEVGSFGGSSVGIMSNRQAWLSVHRSQPVIFRQAAGDGTVLRLEFRSEAEALAFVGAFGGRLTSAGAPREWP